MAAKECRACFHSDDLAIIGFAAIPESLPKILRRIRETADAVVSAKPDALVIIDSPDFTHRVAQARAGEAAGNSDRRLCCPSVWAWRPWPRARDARLRRSCAGAAAVRAEGHGRACAVRLAPMSAIRWSSVMTSCVRSLEKRLRRARPAADSGFARQPRRRDPPHGVGFGRRSRAWPSNSARSKWSCRRCRDLPRHVRAAIGHVAGAGRAL